jgi:cyclopropane fatty-acyl-phospholipid synthase-like methyltransferase
MFNCLNDINIYVTPSTDALSRFFTIKKGITKKFMIAVVAIFSILSFIQMKITMVESPSKRVSRSLIVRNLITALLCGYSFARYGFNILMFLLFFVISIIIHLILTIIEAKTLPIPLDDYVTTTYLYDIYFPKLFITGRVDKTKKTLESLTEGLFKHDAIGLDLDDLSPENVNRVYEYIETTYKNKTKEYFEDKNADAVTIELPDGQTRDLTKLESEGQIQKYDWFLSFIPENIDKEHIRILEVGFGEGNFLRRARSKGFKNIIGVNISQEQVDHAKNNGFEVYCRSYWELNELKLEPFDFIFANGTLEYALPKTMNTIFASKDAEENKYKEFYTIIQENLKPNGIFCNTLLHISDIYKLPYNDFNFWSLWLGNSGNYPSDIITKTALKEAGFETIVYKDATLHYAYWSLLWTLCVNGGSGMSFWDGLRLSMASPFYIFSQIYYSSIPRIFGYNNVFKYHGWLQQFIPRKENNVWKYGTQLGNHRWIVLKKAAK